MPDITEPGMPWGEYCGRANCWMGWLMGEMRLPGAGMDKGAWIEGDGNWEYWEGWGVRPAWLPG